MAREIQMVVIVGLGKGTFDVKRVGNISCACCYPDDESAISCRLQRLADFAEDSGPLAVGMELICPGPSSQDGFRRAEETT